jgi:flagellar biosynthesis regulator FlaF
MHDHVRAARAYSANSAHRSQRDQDADIFRTAAAGLRHSGTTGSIGYSRALEYKKRLWASVIDLLRDPENPLPVGLRASLISVGLAVQREMDTDQPDAVFLASVNDNIAAGLSGQG